jgi:putative transposase
LISPISVARLYKWLAKAEGENAGTPSPDQIVENRELRRRNRVLEQEVEIGARSNGLLRQGPFPKMIYPLVRELADDGIAIRLTCRVLKFSPQGYYNWLKRALFARD